MIKRGGKKKRNLFSVRQFMFLTLILLGIILLEFFYLFLAGGIGGKIRFVQEIIASVNPSSRRIGQIESEAQQLIDTCYSQSDRWKCYGKELGRLTRRTDFSFAEATLSRAQDLDPILRDCHVLAHTISQEATRANPDEWKDLLLNEVDIYKCGTGYMHGVLEVYIGENPDKEINADLVNEVCAIFPDEFRLRSCVHLFAHLLVLEHNGDKIPALTECERITSSVPVSPGAPSLLFECDVGVFMEIHQKNVLADHRIVPPPVINQEYVDMLADGCREYDGIKGEACWHEMGEIYTKLYSYEDPFKVYESCYSEAPRQIEGERCFMKAIVPLTLYWKRDTPEELLSVCESYVREGKTQLYNQCINYMVATLMHYTVRYVDRGVMLCSNVDKPYQGECFNALLGLIKQFVPDPSERESFCEALPNDYKNQCLI